MKKWKWIVVLSVALAALIIWTLWANTALELTEYTVASEGLPEAFDGFRIAQVSDLHNASFGEKNGKLLTVLRASRPDIIAITGDLVDSQRTDISVALEFAREAVKIAPCYYVTGNHEQHTADFEELEQGLIDAGVVVLRKDCCRLERNGETIVIMGVDDCSFYPEPDGNSQVRAMEKDIYRMQSEDYTVLLAHRPELFVVYARYDVELVLSGHAHGGQFRLPLIGGLYAPDQGWFPKYTQGIYRTENQTMVVSRGLGNSAFPLRFNNRPEVVVITLRSVGDA